MYSTFIDDTFIKIKELFCLTRFKRRGTPEPRVAIIL